MNKKLIILFALLFFTFACITSDVTSSSNSSISNSSYETISWNKADDYVGEFRTVCGPVVDSHFASTTGGEPTFLNLGKPYPDPDRFTVLIWGEDRSKFTNEPEDYYFQKEICVSGMIEEYQGSMEIVVDKPSQIKIR